MTAERAAMPLLAGRSSSATWGAVLGAVGLGTVLAFLLYSYFYLDVSNDPFLPPYAAEPPLLWPAALLGLLLLSVVPAALIWRSAEREEPGAITAASAMLAAQGAAFLAGGLWVVLSQDLRPGDDAYSAIVVTVQGYHAVATVAGVAMAASVAYQSARMQAHPWLRSAATATAAWWGYVVLGWIAVGSCLYAYPQLS